MWLAAWTRTSKLLQRLAGVRPSTRSAEDVRLSSSSLYSAAAGAGAAGERSGRSRRKMVTIGAINDLAIFHGCTTSLQGVPVPAASTRSGPANLMRKMFWEIVASRQVSAWKKLHVLYGFFFVRKVVAHLVTFLFYCVVIPAYVLVGGQGQDVRLPKYVAMYVPAIITPLNAVCTPRSWHLLVFWILFENVMSMHHSKATIIGLVEASRANEWIVTEKLGGSATSTSIAAAATTTTMTTKQVAMKKKKSNSSNSSGFLVPEMVMGLCLLYCAIYDIVFGHDHFYVYLLMQSAAAFVVGLGYIGSQ